MKLRRRGFDGDAVAATIERLKERHYLDDVAHSRSLVGRRAGGRGRALIAAELAALGIGREAAEEALSELSLETELETAKKMAARWPGLDAASIAARLRRRGFAGSVIRAAIIAAPSQRA